MGLGTNSNDAAQLRRGRSGVNGMMIVIDQSTATPPFEQLRQQLTTMIRSAALPAGHRLPSVRQLASDLGLANGTVARAYRELEAAGFVATRGRHGTQVLAAGTFAASERTAKIREAAELFARSLERLNATSVEALAAARAAGVLE